MPAGNFCRISEAPSFGFPHTTNICSPGCLGSTGFHGMASLVVKVPWVAPAFAPAAGVASVSRSWAKAWVEIVLASAATTLVNTILFSIDGLLLGKVGLRPGQTSAPRRGRGRSNGQALANRCEAPFSVFEKQQMAALRNDFELSVGRRADQRFAESWRCRRIQLSR